MGKKTNKSFEELFEDLENIVEKMDLGEIELEESLELFEIGMSLVNDGKKKLEKAESAQERLIKAIEASKSAPGATSKKVVADSEEGTLKASQARKSNGASGNK